jgi:hypothetical protein
MHDHVNLSAATPACAGDKMKRAEDSIITAVADIADIADSGVS